MAHRTPDFVDQKGPIIYMGNPIILDLLLPHFYYIFDDILHYIFTLGEWGGNPRKSHKVASSKKFSMNFTETSGLRLAFGFGSLACNKSIIGFVK